MARGSLATFLAFRIPHVSGQLLHKLKDVAFDDAKKLRILRFLHAHSHGDPRQLPPIGAGRPFVDIVSELKAVLADRRGGGSMAPMSYQDRIVVDPAIRSGKPCIKGTRITVYDILEYLAGGMSEDDMLRDFQGLAREDVRAALEFAAARERKLAASSAR